MSARSVVVLAAALTPTLAAAHAGLTVPAPRNTDVRTGTSIKRGPCGPHAPGTGVRTQLVAGAQLTVEFIETINHPGYFQLSFSEVGDTNYVLIADNIPHSDRAPTPSFANPRTYTTTITVPNVSCTGCSLQLIQVMTENPQQPSLYFSCADIEIVGGPGPDAGVPPDAGVEPDAAPAPPDAEPVAPDADPADSGVLAQPDAAPPPPPADAAAPIAEDAASPAASDAGPTNGAVTRNQVSGGCSAVGPSNVGTWATLLGLALALARRRARGRTHRPG